MRAFFRFHAGILNMPVHWQLWLLLLVTVNAFLPLVFIRLVEAQVVLTVFLLSLGLMTLLTARFGFTRILGLGHVLWIPMLAYLLPRLDSLAATEPVGLWLRLLVVLDSISLLIDSVDVIRFARGDRSETVPPFRWGMPSQGERDA